ncbi:hypothetical protein [Methylobacterium sp. CM6247]
MGVARLLNLCRRLLDPHRFPFGIEDLSRPDHVRHHLGHRDRRAYHSHLWGNDTINDLNAGGLTPAQAAAALATQAAAYPNHIFIVPTVTPNTSSTDSFATTTNQTVSSGGVKVLAYNDLVRAGIAGVKLVADISDFVDPYRTGKWPVTRNPADTAATTAAFTGSTSGNTLTVSAVASGTIVRGANLFGSGVNVGATIMATGGTGTYTLSVSQTVASGALTTGGLGTWDGLHPSIVANELIRDRGAALLPMIRR